jgi:hypothetical protein
MNETIGSPTFRFGSANDGIAMIDPALADKKLQVGANRNAFISPDYGRERLRVYVLWAGLLGHGGLMIRRTMPLVY